MNNEEKIFDLNNEEDEKKIIHNVEESIKAQVEKLVIKEHNIHIEKIAFSLFIMFYYNQDFTSISNKKLVNIRIASLKEIWNIGKKEKRVQTWFNLAELIMQLDLHK